ncbi:hypothetical protein [Thiorhodococcus minor]|uniref:Uncharacterized protein n=1 Tax=Thiorhodococcus minor TaxID=57489 RepID=A0A6M0K9D3_9GAMM|nr:hypothetical protein [Thiorhodococcus minor]NEV65317.1 hypothetical protein [Thiorhodococcus minor]
MGLSVISILFGVFTALGASLAVYVSGAHGSVGYLASWTLGGVGALGLWLSLRTLVAAPLRTLETTIREMRQDGDLTRRARVAAGPVGASAFAAGQGSAKREAGTSRVGVCACVLP